MKEYPDAPFYPPSFWSDEMSYRTSFCGTPGCYGGSPYGPNLEKDSDEVYYWSAGWSCPCGCENNDSVFYEDMEDWENV